MNSKFFLKFALVIISIFLFDSALVSAQSDFEGKVKMKVSSGDDVSFINYLVKDKKYRMETTQNDDPEEQGAVIFDPANKKMMMIMPSKKMYMEMPLDISEKVKDKTDWKDELKNIKFTGNTKTIHGYECKEAVYTSDDETSEIWYTQDLGTFFVANFAGDMPKEIKEIAENGFFPMLIITKDEDGEETDRVEVVEVEKMSLSEDLFTPPSGFKKFDMPNMQDMLKNMGQ